MLRLLAYAFDGTHTPVFAASMPTRETAGWGYCDNEHAALPLTLPQWREFAAYQRDIGRAAFCFPCPNP